MKGSYGKGRATRPGPELCCCGGDTTAEVLVGLHAGRLIEHVAKQLHHTAQRTVVDQRQPEDQLSQPCRGDRQVEEHPLVVAVRGQEGGVECLFSLGSLLKDELATDRVLSGQTADVFIGME